MNSAKTCKTTATTQTTHNRFVSIISIFSIIMTLSALLAFVVMPTTTAHAANWFVSSTADDGGGSLRQIIAAANNGDTVVFDDTLANNPIVLASPITINKDIVLDGTLSVDGDIVVSGGNTTQIFVIAEGANVAMNNLTFTAGTSAANGGAIVNNGNLALQHVAFTANKATNDGGALFNAAGASLSMQFVTMSDNSAKNGGALRNLGNLAMSNTTLANNTATNDGGALYDGGTTAIEATLFQGNEATNNGGGIVFYSEQYTAPIIGNTAIISNTADIGGGLYVSSSQPTLTNVTISTNHAKTTGGGIRNFGALTLDSVTIANNSAGDTGGGINADAPTGGSIYDPYDLYANDAGVVTLHNCIVASNSAPNSGANILGGVDPQTNINNVSSQGYNIFQTITGFTYVVATGDQRGVNPLLGKLTLHTINGDDGVGWAHLPLHTSPAVDRGACDGNTSDERGFTRPQNDSTLDDTHDGCDIGAIEIVVPTANDDIAATSAGKAIDIDVVKAGEADGADGKDTHSDDDRTIDATSVKLLNPETGGLTAGPINASKGTVQVNADGTIHYVPFNVSLLGEDSFTYVVFDDAGWSSNRARVTVELEIPCTTPDLIAAIETANEQPNRDTIFVSVGCTYAPVVTPYNYPAAAPLPDGYTHGQPSPLGAAAFPDILSPIIIKTIEMRTNADVVSLARDENAQSAFRLFNVGSTGDVQLVNLSLSNGATPLSHHNGGGIFATGALTLTGTMIDRCNAFDDGGAIYSTAHLELQRIDIDYPRNQPDYSRNTTLSNNTAGKNGGAIAHAGGALILSYATLSDNTATNGSGGAVWSASTSLTMDNSALTDNRAGTDGGAISTTANATLTACRVSENSAGGNGGAITSTALALTLRDSTLSDNTATNGGALYHTGGALEVRGGTIGGSSTAVGNTASAAGGGIFHTGGDALLRDVDVRYNSAGTNGGGIFHTGGDLTLYNWNVRVRNNSAKGDGGGVYHTGGDLLMERGGNINDNTAGRNGGGIAMQTNGTLASFIDANIYANTATADGGGVWLSGGALSANRISFHENTATVNGGGLALINATTAMTRTTIRHNIANTDGGGVYLDGGAFSLQTSTLSTNGADIEPVTPDVKTQHGGGLFATGGASVQFANSTVTANAADTGAGVQLEDDSTAQLFSTILSGNPDKDTDENCVGTGFLSLGNGYNLVGQSCNTAGIAAANDKTATNPQLGELADNGFWRYTHMLLSSSPALNMGSCSPRYETTNDADDITPLTSDRDQRNAERPIAKEGATDDDLTGGGKFAQGTDYALDWCDIGAVEGILFRVNSTDDDDSSAVDDGEVTLRSALEESNQYASRDVIEFAIKGNEQHPITPASPLPAIRKPLVVRGASQPGSACANTPVDHTLNIVLDGSNAGAGTDGLVVTGGDTEIHGIAIEHFSGDAIQLQDEGGNVVQCTKLQHNGAHGINIVGNSASNSINRWNDNTGRNYIYANGGSGIFIEQSTRNTIRMNDVFSNTLLGIDLAPVGIVTNDDRDGDSGANDGQNYPEITAYPQSFDADGTPEWTTVSGELYSAPNSTYRIELFTNSDCEIWNGEGQSYRLAQTVYTNGNGRATFSFDIDPDWRTQEGEPYVSLTASDERGNTSEFSLCSMYNSTISGKVWLDLNRNGLDSNENGMANITVRLYTPRGRHVATATTANDGTYTFNHVANGTYYLQFQVPTGYKTTTQDVDDDDTIDSDPATDGKTITFSLPNGDTTTHQHWDMGLKITGFTTEGSDGSKNPDTIVAVSEEGTTQDYYELYLNNQPDSDIKLTIATDGQTTVTPMEWTFTPENWNTRVKVDVTAVDDDLVEEPLHTGIITNTLTGKDSDFTGVELVHARVTDNDSANVAIEPNEFDVYEGAFTPTTFRLWLTRQPTRTVTISFDMGNPPSGDQQLQQIEPVTFTPENWHIPRTLSVVAVDDTLLEGDDTRIVQPIVASDDPAYDGIAIERVLITIHDSLVRIDPLEITDLEEGGEWQSYEIWLTEQPSSTITIRVLADTQQLIAEPAMLTFDINDYNKPQTVKVWALRDGKKETLQHTSLIEHTIRSDDGVGIYDGLQLATVKVFINDMDSANLMLSELMPDAVYEEGTTQATYGLQLSQQPTATVTVNLVSDGQVSVIPNRVVFEPDNWDFNPIITVKAVDDILVEPTLHIGKITHMVSSDTEYDGLVVRKEIPIYDNDEPSILVRPTNIKAYEGGDNGVYTISLPEDKKPDQDVLIQLTTDDPSQIVFPQTVSFKLANDDWKNAKEVVVQAVDDTLSTTDNDGVTIKHTVISDGSYKGVDIATVDVTIVDNDKPGVDVEPNTQKVVENGTGYSYRLQLTKPIADGQHVVVKAIAGDGVLLKTDTFTFTSDSQAAIVTFKPLNDDITQAAGRYGSSITHRIVESNAPGYTQELAITSADIIVLDDESAGVALTPLDIALVEGEPGGETFQVRLLREPLNDVTVSFHSVKDGVYINPPEWTFNAADWTTDTVKLITVSARDNELADGNRTDTITTTTQSDDPSYDGTSASFAIDDIAVAIVDDESPNIIFTPDAVTVAEGGTPATYQLSLAATPASDVTVQVVADSPSDVIIRPRIITFTKNVVPTPRTITVQALHDESTEGTETLNLIATVASSSNPDDPYINTVPPLRASVALHIVEAGLQVEPRNVEVSEGGASTSYAVTLTYTPTADVVVSLAPNSQVKVVPRTLTFAAGATPAPQLVQLTAVDDTAIEWEHTGLVIHAMQSSDAAFNSNGFGEQLEVVISDNDYPSVVVSLSSVETSEGGTPAEYSVSLTYTPTHAVQVLLAPTSPQCQVVPSVLTWEPGSDVNWWRVQPQVTVTATDDAIAEGQHTCTVSHTVSCAGCAGGEFPEMYNNLDTLLVQATIDDNDSPGVVISNGDELVVNEAGETGASYNVQLLSQPAADVTLTFLPDEQVRVVPAYMVFDASNWNRKREVMVYAVDDAIGEAAQHVGVVRHSLASNDSAYADATRQFAVADVQVTVLDNEVAGVQLTPTSLDVTEGGATASYRARLTIPPPSNASVRLHVEPKLPNSVQTIPADGVVWEYDAANADWWSTEKIITVRAVDDAIAEGLHSVVLEHWTESSDAHYARDQFVIDPVNVTIHDNDSAGVGVVPTSVTVSEDGTSAKYRVRLLSQPTHEVIVQLNSPDGQTTLVPPTLTWSPSDGDTWWSTEKQVTVQAIDDAIAEGRHIGRVSHSVSSFDPQYNDTNIAIDEVQVTIDDNDSAGVTVDPVAVNVSEDGTTATYSVKLNSQPMAAVRVTLGVADATSVQVVPPFVEWVPSAWETEKIITVSAIDDSLAEGQHNGRITHAISSSDPNYQPTMIAVPDVIATIDDNDSAGVSITPLLLQVSEDGVGGDVNVQLTSEPRAPVTLTFALRASASGQLSVIPQSLTFDATNWNVARVVRLSAVDDAVAEGLHTATVEATISSTDANYAPNQFAIAPIDVTIQDNDWAGVTINPTSVRVSEDGTIATYSVKLNSQPTAPVSLQLTNAGQINVIPPSLTWQPSDGTNWWQTEKIITVEAINDSVAEGLHTGAIQHSLSSTDANYTDAFIAVSDVAVTIDDNDSAGISITPLAVNISEDGTTATYNIKLNSQPTAAVRLDIGQTAQTTTKPPFVQWQPSEWGTEKVITVYAVDDAVAEGLHTSRVTHAISSTDTNYNGSMFAIAAVETTITDNDAAGVSITPLAVEVSEDGNVGEYRVKLTSQPVAEVTITMSELGSTKQISTTPKTLTFDATNWHVERTIKVEAVDDFVAEASHATTIKHTVASTDPNYQPTMIILEDVAVTIQDNDSAGVTIVPTSVSVSEAGDTATYNIKLNSQPTADVVITMHPNAQVGVKPPDKTFTVANWNVAQQIEVTAVDDAIAEGLHTGAISHTIASTDPNYQPNMFALERVAVEIDDNDSAGVNISIPDEFIASEDGDIAAYDVQLNSQPTGDVLVRVDNPDGQTSVEPVVMLFTPSDWNTARQVFVSAVDDNIVEGLHSGVLKHSIIESNDPNYNDTMFAIDNARVEIKDNDAAGVRIVPIEIALSESGITAAYSVTLTSQPSATVTIAIAPQNGQTSVTSSSLVFDTTNWSQAQRVDVSAIDDAIAEETHEGTIKHTIASDDTNYQAGQFWLDIVRSTITDNDAAGVQLSPQNLLVVEGGASATYSVTLTTVPTSTVVVSVTVDDQLRVEPGKIIFEPPTDGGAVAPQLVTVAAVDDDAQEGMHSSIIKHTVMSADTQYNGTRFDPPSVHTTIRDNDGAGLIMISVQSDNDENTLQVDEGGRTSYQIVCTTPPSETVNIAIEPHEPERIVLTPTKTLSLTTLTTLSSVPAIVFTPEEWSQPRDVDVQAVDNLVYEGPVSTTIRHVANSNDIVFNHTPIADVVVMIGENDILYHHIYLPMIGMQSKPGIDLIGTVSLSPVQNSYTSDDAVAFTVIITNSGTASTGSGGFYVDLYLNPSTPPTGANQPWDEFCEQGITWYVQEDVAPSKSVRLSSQPGSTFYVAGNSIWHEKLPVGVKNIYIYVDSWHKNPTTGEIQTFGTIPEVKENNNSFLVSIPAVTAP